MENLASINGHSRLKGLDGLRFIGSLIILVHHIEKSKSLYGLPCIKSMLSESGIGTASMTLFFTLSGFLITYILFIEKIKTNNIVLKNFYIKRIFRIWPLYYILLILGITVFTYLKFAKPPNSLSGIKNDYYIVVFLYAFHLSNFQVFFASSIKSLAYYWSLGVEEQFYAFWPLIIKHVNNYVKIFIIIIIVKIGVKLLIALSYRILPLSYEQVIWMQKIEHFLLRLRFEAFAFGGIGAYLFVTNKKSVLNFIYKPWVQWINIILLLLSLPVHNFTETIHVFYAISFTLLILNMVGNAKAIFSLNNKYTSYIGKVSYGIYMYQIPVLIIILNILKPYYTQENSLIWNILLYFISCTIVISISILSHEFIEKKFIVWSKNKTDRLNHK